MNQKQVKLLRYFIKASGDLGLAAQVKSMWSRMDADAKGKVTSWLKRVIMTLRAVKDETKRKKLAANLKILEAFST